MSFFPFFFFYFLFVKIIMLKKGCAMTHIMALGLQRRRWWVGGRDMHGVRSSRRPRCRLCRIVAVGPRARQRKHHGAPYRAQARSPTTCWKEEEVWGGSLEQHEGSGFAFFPCSDEFFLPRGTGSKWNRLCGSCSYIGLSCGSVKEGPRIE